MDKEVRGAGASYAPMDGFKGPSAKTNFCLVLLAGFLVFCFILEAIAIIILAVDYSNYRKDHGQGPRCQTLCIGCDEGWTPREAVPRFVFNLDDAPERRWEHILGYLYDRYGWEYSFQPFWAELQGDLGGINQTSLAEICNATAANSPEWAAEMRGISEFFVKKGHVEITYEYVVRWAMFYEVMHGPGVFNGSTIVRGCTGVLSRGTNGRMYQGRNLDFPKSFLNVTVQLDWVKAQKTVLRTTSFVGWGSLVATGVKPRAFSVAINWRQLDDFISLEDTLAYVKSGGLPIGWATRKAALESSSFSEFRDAIATMRLGAPAYFIIAGAGEGESTGCVLTRDRGTHLARNTTLGDGGYYHREYMNNTWFLVQTNNDSWWADPVYDPRRPIAIRALEWFGQRNAASHDGIWKVMSATGMDTRGVLNPETCFTSIMCPEEDYMLTFYRRFPYYAPRADWNPILRWG